MTEKSTRRAAADLLMAVTDERRTLDDALARTESFDVLTASDRGFARLMVSSTLRQLGRIDIGLSAFMDRPIERTTPAIRALLRLGAAQSWLLETPDHAVVDETVQAAKSWAEARNGTGFLNAVLRKVVAERGPFDDTGAQQIWPGWLLKDVSIRLGEPVALSLIEAQTETPELHLTPRNGDAATLAAATGGTAFGQGSVVLGLTAVEALAGYEKGAFWVQDAAAALPAQLLAAQPGETVLDLCAAPGGKTMQLAATGADVIALDRSAPRLKRLKANLKRTGLSERVTIVTADGASWVPDEPVDKILLDAPCSALGTLRRHPEGVWIKSAEDVARFSGIQARLLKAAINQLKPGGTLVYCVCSPRPQEGLDIVNEEIEAGLVERLPVQAEDIPGFEASLTPQGDLLTLPKGPLAQGSMAQASQENIKYDAFFISRLRKPV